MREKSPSRGGLFRSGDSEYLLNGKLCRLRDIQELFMGTGLGPESYALIEQGRIGQILSSRPTDRRAIIEEAAGITKFKTKKRLAEARLEDAKLNLDRINDIFDEVTRQMNSLKRQASKAERYARLRDEMRANCAWSCQQVRPVGSGERAKSIADQLAVGGNAAAVRLRSSNSKRTCRTHAARVCNRSRDSREPRAPERDQAGNRSAPAQRRHNEERCEELIVRSASSEAESSKARQRLTALEEEWDSNRQMLESAAADLALAQQELEQCQQLKPAQAANALAALEQQQEAVARRHHGSGRRHLQSAQSA